MQWYRRSNMSNHMVNEEKRTILMSTQDNAIAVFLDQQSQRSSFSLIQKCLIFLKMKTSDMTL